jgi:hypothetical protein
VLTSDGSIEIDIGCQMFVLGVVLKPAFVELVGQRTSHSKWHPRRLTFALELCPLSTHRTAGLNSDRSLESYITNADALNRQVVNVDWQLAGRIFALVNCITIAAWHVIRR